MHREPSRPPAGAIISLPLASLLVVFFFMPWLKLSCNTEAMAKAARPFNGQAMPQELAMSMDLAEASGWELATGQIALKGPYKEHEEGVGGDEGFPKSRPWVYLCLVVPIALLIVGAMGLCGSVSPRGASKGMLLLALGGLGLMLGVASVDYTDDLIEQAEEQMGQQGLMPMSPFSPQSPQKALAQMKDQMSEVIETNCTGYLWISLGLYGLIAT